VPYAELVVPNTLIELNIDQELVCVAAASGERPHAVFHSIRNLLFVCLQWTIEFNIYG